MTNEGGSHLGGGVVYEGRLPLGWKALRGEPGPQQMLQLNDHNDAVLRTLLALEEAGGEYADDGGVASQQELARIEAKLNLLLNLVGQLLGERSAIPAKASVCLGAEFVEWSDAKLPPAGQWVVADIYLHPSYPRPLRLVGIARAGEGRFESPSAGMALAGLSEPVQDALEKLIFRHHRRAVAQARARRNAR